MNNQEQIVQQEQKEPTLHDIAYNRLCMTIAQLQGQLGIIEAENEILRRELDKLRNKEDTE